MLFNLIIHYNLHLIFYIIDYTVYTCISIPATINHFFHTAIGDFCNLAWFLIIIPICLDIAKYKEFA